MLSQNTTEKKIILSFTNFMTININKVGEEESVWLTLFLVCGIDLLSGKCSSIRPSSGVLSKQATYAQLPDLLAGCEHRDIW